jgi:hypothetical protein
MCHQVQYLGWQAGGAEMATGSTDEVLVSLKRSHDAKELSDSNLAKFVATRKS